MLVNDNNNKGERILSVVKQEFHLKLQKIALEMFRMSLAQLTTSRFNSSFVTFSEYCYVLRTNSEQN